MPGGVAVEPGRIEGSVTLPAGVALESVRVELECACAGQTQRLRLNIAGAFSFTGLGPGRYTVRAEGVDAEGVEQRAVTTIELGPGTQAQLELALEPVAAAPATVPAPALDSPPPAATLPAPPPEDGKVFRRVGLGVTVLGVVVGIGGTFVAFQAPCGKDGSRGANCETDVRNTLALSSGVLALGAIVGGVSSMAVGQALKRRHRLQYGREHGVSVSASGTGAGLVWSGRF
ncbi:hypothetical protein PPSIR1_12298 [Plesiocystis pacifica SIR-1]|uniref:Carboxypeptidase regulatory-like domain-containing protein n=1 Tax=Plesiocystis pacifica SIR-1 TaxID=391625 RepID=A6G5Y9_9BACT|nr:hypothetical protein PPSIR1_12298 [Plesiocystis pacifica SIR-1]